MGEYDERSRPAVWGPVLIAVIFLAIIGGSAGWVLGDRAQAADERRTAEEQRYGEQPGGALPPEAIGEDPPANDGTVDGGDQGGGDQGGDGGHDGGVDHTAPGGNRCPEHTLDLIAQRGVAGDARLVLYLRTERSQVWICAVGDTLFYQGHRGGPGGRLVEGYNALFLTTVERAGHGYLATNKSRNGTTTYDVTKERLIRTTNGRPDTEPAIR